MKTVRYGIIGCGMMGFEHLRNIALIEGAEVAAIYEPDASMRGAAKTLAPDAVFANSLAEVLAVDAVNCLLVASPNHCHADQLAEIATTRPLPLLMEKPLLTDPADIPRLKAIAASYPEPIWVAMEYRFMPPIAAFLQQVKEATGGIKMLSIREHRFPFLVKVGNWNRFNRNSGGTFVEKCCHFFDLMRLTLGAEPVRVMASAGQDANHLHESYEGEVPDILDNGFVIVEFDNGARAMLDLCMFAEGSRYQEQISAVGPMGKIEVNVPGPGRFWPKHLGKPPVATLEVSPRSPQGPVLHDIPVDDTLLDAGDHNGATFYQHHRFVQLVRGEIEAPDVSFADGLRAVEMGMAAQESAATGCAVTLF